ncbi:hypothetical protein LshimejAT787_0202420 [Lyophyllum shimeji]|uniref:Cupredoxin n=1 Tax=Lyophyllum shimeji TaxID=47721 RepID=A0A9P3UIU5_LYOSH|nr:hypothetical protein LshimejAT787_0202420 [Lyophyllum shimeji]
MHFSATVVALACATLAVAVDHQVLVGDGGSLAFSPTSLTAASGDTISFQFRAKNHSVTQSTFANPCSIMTTPKAGVDSGFQLVEAGATQFPTFSITVDDPTTPLWFFCAQTAPANHCQAGMVFAVNAPPDKSFDAFQANAKASSANSTSPSGGASGTGAPLSTGSPTASGSTPTATDTNTLSGFVTSTVTQPTATGASTNTASAPAGSPTGNSAVQLDRSASSVLALIGLFAGLML